MNKVVFEHVEYDGNIEIETLIMSTSNTGLYKYMRIKRDLFIKRDYEVLYSCRFYSYGEDECSLFEGLTRHHTSSEKEERIVYSDSMIIEC